MPLSPAPIVRFLGVEKSYDGVTRVVRHLDLEIARGEFLTLLGPSGSGKTTTLMMLAGFEEPTAGRIEIEGRDVSRLPPHRRGIGVVFQSYALFPHMTVAENVAFPLAVRGVARAERAARVARALEMVRLGGFGGRRPAQLSGGQQQRVALARALVFEPALVLMDEPLGALDKQLRAEMQLEIRHLHEALGVTVVYVTHDQEEALTLSDRIAVFHQGAVQQLDAPAALYERPANAFVARFIGENNRLAGTVAEIDAADGMARVALAGGRSLWAMRGDCGPPGAAAVVSIRPERIALAAGPAADLSEDAIPARVLETIYLGDHVRVRLALEGGAEVMAKRPIAAADPRLVPGAEAAVAWQPEHAIAFAPEPAD
ncbi:ABC transporter ATP-binding protein [Elioraea sp.]|jgi:putative spermidine/putrescine transport system ATP-binding protein|uniref:ABC transporter ATP-binding protein n=1 Tax=Elioraea sp. TaxID=2185103 RepID=UPI0021DEA9AB|nr:ABC transporter ATP-binding protein [Elioraea sp.]GIX10243.1 MAG: polyamine-transporting ATPase [Elioraea sp.]